MRYRATVAIALGSLGLGVVLGASGRAAWAEDPAVNDPAEEPVSEAPRDYSRYQKLDVFARALALLEQGYVRPVDDEALIYAALDGMTDALDPHTEFLSPREAKMLMEDMDGRFGGVGLVVTLDREPANSDDELPGPIFLDIREVIPSGPAARAGLVKGDRITHIEGRPVGQFVDLQDAILVMRGRAGTPVSFTFVHDDGEPQEVTVQREVVDAPALEVKYLDDGIGVLRLRSFQETTSRELRAGLAELRKTAKGDAGGESLRGVVLDLRDNGGGLLMQAIAVVDLFVPSGVIVRTRGRRGRVISVDRATPGGTERDLPLVVLINKASASASEIVAGALQDHGRAAIVGERSYGKGSVQTPVRLQDGSLLKFTTALYYTPNDRLIQASGIGPDVEIGMQAAAVEDSRPGLISEREVEGHLEPESFGRPRESEDARTLAELAVLDDVQLAGAVRQLELLARLAGHPGTPAPAQPPATPEGGTPEP